jgi:CheY-like chemotaxis protein
MNILIVDDDGAKVERIKRVLENFSSEPMKIEVSTSVAEAVNALTIKKFDLALLDLNLPIRKTETPRKDGGVRVLKELKRNQAILKPTFVIGLTSHNDLKTVNQDFFEIEGWTLFEIDNANFDWEEAILNKVNHIHNAKPKKAVPKKNSGPGVTRGDRHNISLTVFWAIICPVVTAGFFLGFYFGQTKFDKEKSDLYEENKILRKRLELLSPPSGSKK